MNRDKTIIIGLVAAIIVSIVVFTIIGTSQSSGFTASLTTSVTPTAGSTIKINDVTVPEGQIKLRPGAYSVVFSREGFTPETRTVVLKENENAKVSVVLAGNTESTKDWYAQNPNDSEKAEGITGRESVAKGTAKIVEQPVIQRLPRIVRNTYRIDYGLSVKHPNDDTKTAIIITQFVKGSETKARNWLKYQGYDDSNTEIIVKENYLPTSGR